MSTYISRELQRIGIPIERIGAVQKQTKITSYKPHCAIWKQGEEVNDYCMVVDGLVAANAPAAQSAVSVDIYGTKMWFGEAPIINKKPTHLEYCCLSDVEIISFPAVLMQELFKTELSFSNYVGETMAWRVRRQSESLVAMRLGNPPLRAITGIALFAETLAYSGERPPTIGMGSSYQIPIKQAIFASLCGVSRTAFSECAQKLEKAGWIEIMYGRIEIKGLESWRGFIRSRSGRAWGNLSPTIDELIEDLSRASQLDSIL